MNMLLRRFTRAGNCLYQVSRFLQTSIIVTSLNNGRLLSNDSVDDSDTSKAFVISGKSERLPAKYTNIEVVNKTLGLLGENPKVAKCETIRSVRSRKISVELTSSDDVYSLLSKRYKLLNTGIFIMAKQTKEERKNLYIELEEKKAEEPTKRWVIRDDKVTTLEHIEEYEATRHRTVLIEGQLTEEIESGSELPVLEVINNVFSILGHSPSKIEGWQQQYYGTMETTTRNYARLIFVKLPNADDALKLVKNRSSLRDYGKLYLSIARSDASNAAHLKLVEEKVEEKEQKIIEDPSMYKYHYIYNGKVHPKPHHSLPDAKNSNSDLPSLRVQSGNLDTSRAVLARTVVISGQLTEEIESGSELPGFEVISKVFSILGHSPSEIKGWKKHVEGNGARLIFVRLTNADDALKLVKNRVSLKDYGKLFIAIARSDAKIKANSKLVEEKKQKRIEDPSMYHYIYNGKVHSKPHHSLPDAKNSNSDLPSSF